MKNKYSQNRILKRVLAELLCYAPYLILSLFCAVVTVLLSLMIPVLSGKAVDCIHGVNQVDFAGLLLILRKMCVVVAGTFLSQWIMNLLNNHVTYALTKNLRKRAFQTLQNLKMKEIDSHAHGDYISRIVTDADVFSDGLLLGFSQLFTGVMTIIGTLIFMVRINAQIALIVIIMTPVSLLIAHKISSKTYAMFQKQAMCRADQTAYAEEMIFEQKLVRRFHYETNTEEEFNKRNEALSESSLKATFFSSTTNPSTRFVNALIYSSVGAAGALLAIGGNITVGGLTSFLGYASQYAKPFNEITGVITEMQNAIACAGRIFEMIDLPQIVEKPTHSLENVRGKVTIAHVDFSYEPGEPLIENLNLEVTPGERVAIVGPTGSGKTTLINLLMHFYEVTAGQIQIDDVDITTISRENLRSQFGMVLQETWLKKGTILENLQLADEKASLEEIQNAAKKSHADEFIRKLPQGYDTILGEDGGVLSQGQKQLLCITRIMLSLPPMLILDEATSSIDTRTEMKIQDAFAKMMKGRTTFVVAHRLSTIKNADMILYMNHGKVLEQGTHEELLKKQGYYAKMYYSQFLA